MDKEYGYGSQQDRRRRKKDDRRCEEDIDDRLSDGFDMMSDDDQKDVSELAKFTDLEGEDK